MSRTSEELANMRFKGLVALMRFVQRKYNGDSAAQGLSIYANNRYNTFLDCIDRYAEFYSSSHNANFKHASLCADDPETCGCRKPCVFNRLKKLPVSDECAIGKCECVINHHLHCDDIDECRALVESGLFQLKPCSTLIKNHPGLKFKKPNFRRDRTGVTRQVCRKVINLLLVHRAYPDLEISSLRSVLCPDLEMKKRLLNARALSKFSACVFISGLKGSDCRVRGTQILLAEDPYKGDEGRSCYDILHGYTQAKLSDRAKSDAIHSASKKFTWLFNIETLCIIFSINYAEFKKAVSSDVPLRYLKPCAYDLDCDDSTDEAAGDFIAKRHKSASS